MTIPLQYAVVCGVALSVALYVIGQSNKVTVRRRVLDESGGAIETDPPELLPPHEVVILQPYGSLFFAAAPIFEAALPAVTSASHDSVVILRLRERSDVGSTFIGVLRRYAGQLADVGSKLVLVSVNQRLGEQFRVTGLAETIGADNVYGADMRVGLALERANRDPRAWVASRQDPEEPDDD